MYINSQWLDHVHIPAYLTSFGVSEEIELQINKELLQILSDSKKKSETISYKDLSGPTRLLGTLTHSILQRKEQKRNVKLVQSMLNSLHCVRSKEDIGTIIGEYLRYRIPTCMTIFTSPSESNSLKNYICFSTGNLGLIDTSYYTEKSQFKLHAINAYSNLLKKIENHFSIDNLQLFLQVEHMAALALEKSKHDDEKRVKGSSLHHMYPHIPWESIVQSSFKMNKEEFHKTEFLLLSTTWLENMNTWFKTFTLEMWVAWLSGNLIVYTIPLLPPPFDDYHYELFGNRLRGQTQKTPQEELALDMTQQWLTGPLGELYVNNYVTEELKKQATEIAQEIKNVAEKRLGSLEWLEPNTQQEAKKKIKAISLCVAYPKNMEAMNKKFKNITLLPETFLQNIFYLSQADFLDEIQQTGKSLDRHYWDDPVFAVNAYYYNEGNRLILPSGILRWPFFDSKASDGWNFGGIGSAIGHEMTHAFDIDGKEYDHVGNKRNWWSKEDNNQYMIRTRALEKLYSNTQYFGKPLNGKLTLSENIADLGGLGIALTALKTTLDKKGIQGSKRKKELQDFFKSFAVSWRTKEKKQKAIQSLFMDVHAPPPARVNNIVSQFDDWYECFDVQPGDKLYIDPKQRIQIF